MKAKRLLYLVTLAGILALTVAVPAVAADDAIPMWVHRARLAYCGRSSGGPDRVVAYIHVRDAENAMVTDAEVTGEWTLPDGTVVEKTRLTGFLTGSQGIADFTIWAGRGEYKFCVTDVTKDEWQYDASLDRESCPTFWVW
jgi:hypothetical protein